MFAYYNINMSYIYKSPRILESLDMTFFRGNIVLF